MSYLDKPTTKVLVFGGKTGWIGGLMCDMIGKEGTVMAVIVVYHL